jgi:hypothetical protein
VAQVSWQVEQDPDGSMVLVRRERTPPDPQVDETQDPSVVRTVMSRTVTGMNVYCYDGTQWLEQWDAGLPSQGTISTGTTQNSPAGLPQAVQVTLTFAREGTGSRAQPTNQPSANDLPLSVVVAMPGAQIQAIQNSTAGGSG